MVNIQGLEKWQVTKALHAKTHAQGMGFLHDRGELTDEQAKEDVAQHTQDNGKIYFDYLRGRVMKVEISGDEFDPWLFDRDNYEGAAQEAITKLRAQLMQEIA